MAQNSRNSQKPTGQKYKVTFTRNGVEDYMMLYAESEKSATTQLKDAWSGASIKIVKVEEA